MSRRIIPRDLVAEQLAISPHVLIRYESMGFIEVSQDTETSQVGYEPAQVRRIWSILSYQRDLGINLAGVEVILRLNDHLRDVHEHLRDLATELDDLLNADHPSQSPRN